MVGGDLRLAHLMREHSQFALGLLGDEQDRQRALPSPLWSPGYVYDP
jgi:hypothetical protein